MERFAPAMLPVRPDRRPSAATPAVARWNSHKTRGGAAAMTMPPSDRGSRGGATAGSRARCSRAPCRRSQASSRPPRVSPRARTAPGSVGTLIALAYQNHAWLDRFSGSKMRLSRIAVHGWKHARDERRVRRIGDCRQDAGHACPRALLHQPTQRRHLERRDSASNCGRRPSIEIMTT